MKICTTGFIQDTFFFIMWKVHISIFFGIVKIELWTLNNCKNALFLFLHPETHCCCLDGETVFWTKVVLRFKRIIRSVAKRSGDSAHGSLFFSALRCYFFRNLLRLWWLLCIILKKFCFSVENFCNTTALQLSTFCFDLKWRLSSKSCFVFLRRWRWKHNLKADLLWRHK